jgi:hypothetical protein
VTPLGERGRGHRWGATVAWYAAGAVVGGGVVGAALGALGAFGRAAVAPSATAAALTLSGAVMVGLLLDAGRRLPTIRRQVNEDWLRRYRGWAYAAGFGLQLGAGFVTVVSISAVYMAFVAAFLSGSAFAGGAIGAAFGLGRGLSMLSVAGVRDRTSLLAVDARLSRWDLPARRAALVAEALVAAGLLVAAR